MTAPTMKIWQTITPETWCQGVSEKYDRSRCAVEWLAAWYGWVASAHDKFAEANGIKGLITAWNDAPERTFEEVKEAFRKADL